MQDPYAGMPGTFVLDADGNRQPIEEYEAQQVALAAAAQQESSNAPKGKKTEVTANADQQQ